MRFQFSKVMLFVVLAGFYFCTGYSLENDEAKGVLNQMEVPKLFVATKAFINQGGKILILRESNKYIEGTNTGFFDVVGGRITPGERFEECLMREIQEETGLNVEVGQPFFVGEWRPVVKGEPWQVVGIFFECFADSDEVVLSEDHNEYKWIDPMNFKNENLIPPRNGGFDLRTVFEAYLAKGE